MSSLYYIGFLFCTLLILAVAVVAMMLDRVAKAIRDLAKDVNSCDEAHDDLVRAVNASPGQSDVGAVVGATSRLATAIGSLADAIRNPKGVR